MQNDRHFFRRVRFVPQRRPAFRLAYQKLQTVRPGFALRLAARFDLAMGHDRPVQDAVRFNHGHRRRDFRRRQTGGIGAPSRLILFGMVRLQCRYAEFFQKLRIVRATQSQRHAVVIDDDIGHDLAVGVVKIFPHAGFKRPLLARAAAPMREKRQRVHAGAFDFRDQRIVKTQVAPKPIIAQEEKPDCVFIRIEMRRGEFRKRSVRFFIGIV